ncbi:kinase and exchange factor for Rac B-like isoform X2 [Schistocerca gregaria]|uniref:kinase and exchange factor for Rac B-like isoform X2 n=1 Tax=Schistocerca gregaria TaxID=7010 RepID=UPI00211DBFC9|nr:kinase and exchange factor for Rac B-like isoform X2 [Schistocerca gregaria]
MCERDTGERTDVHLVVETFKEDPISFVSQEELNLIAGNMMSILSLSEMFFENLSFRMAYFDPDTTLLGDVLAVFVPLISIYTEYCYRHRERVQTIRRLSAENARFRGVLERGTAASNGQDIYAHCVLPIQRISRYRLLFESLLLATDKTHLDYPNLEKAFNLVRDKISDINRKLAISDQQNNLVLLSFRLDAPVLPDQELLQPWRTLSGEYKIKYLRPSKHNVYSMHSWIHAYLYICNDIFIIAAKSKANATTWDPQDKLRIITTQLLWNSFLSQVAEQRLSRLQIFSHVLQILNPEGSWIIASDEKQQMAQLKECFQTQQKLYLSLHPEKRFERRKTKQSINDDLKLWMAAGFSPNQSFNKNGKKTCDSPVKQKYVTLSKLSNKSSSTNLKKNFNKICGELGKAITRKPSQ